MGIRIGTPGPTTSATLSPASLQGPQKAVEYGAAHAVLGMTTPGDTSMALLHEVWASAWSVLLGAWPHSGPRKDMWR